MELMRFCRKIGSKRFENMAIFILSFLLAFPSLTFSSEINVYFSPNGGCQNAVSREISKAQKSIDIAMYELTSREITQALIEAKDRHLEVRIVLDKDQEKKTYSKGRYLLKYGFDVRYDTGSGLMHNKFAVIDDKVLITGSFNWTASAEERNEENLLVLTDREVIKAYIKRFEYLYAKARKSEQEGVRL